MGGQLGIVLWVCCFLRGLAFSTSMLQEADPVPEELRTVAEDSQFESTCTSEEVIRFLKVCDERSEQCVFFEFGRTSQGQPLVGAIFGNDQPTSRPKDDRLVVMLLGNIHSGECDGKEALLMLARELTLNPSHPWLQQAVFVIVPNYNADGNNQMALDNRPGQIGPVRGMGRRETAQGFDLNRDFIKLETPEAKSVVSLINEWDPHVFIDCHTTNGSIHRYQLTYDIPHNPASPATVRDFFKRDMMPVITSRMKAAGFDTFYYGNFAREMTRWESYGFEPRYSTEYLGLRGRLGILSESYSYADYRTRIFVTREFVRQCVDYSLENADRIRRMLDAVDDELSAPPAPDRATDRVPLDAVMSPYEDKVRILGRAPNSEEPRDYELEYWGNYRATRDVQRPWAYAIPKPTEAVLANLRNHGLEVQTLSAPRRVSALVRTIESLQRADRPFQKHRLVRVTVSEQVVDRELPAGTVIVRTTQPLGRLAVWLLEPTSADGLVTWNFFDAELSEGAEYPVLSIPSEVPF